MSQWFQTEHQAPHSSQNIRIRINFSLTFKEFAIWLREGSWHDKIVVLRDEFKSNTANGTKNTKSDRLRPTSLSLSLTQIRCDGHIVIVSETKDWVILDVPHIVAYWVVEVE